MFQITGLTLNKTYISDYLNASSRAYKIFAVEIESALLSLLQNGNETSNSSIIGVKVTSLRNGSVLVDMVVGSRAANLSASAVKSGVNNGINNGDLASLGATGTIEVQGINILG